MSAKKPAEPIVEPMPIGGVWVDGLSAMQTLGGVTHLIFTARQPDVQGSAPRIERVVQARLVVPTDQLQVIGRALLGGAVALVGATGESGEPATLN